MEKRKNTTKITKSECIASTITSLTLTYEAIDSRKFLGNGQTYLGNENDLTWIYNTQTLFP